MKQVSVSSVSKKSEPDWVPLARQLRASGVLYKVIAGQFGVSESMVYYWIYPDRRESIIRLMRELRRGREKKPQARGPRLFPEWLPRAEEMRSRGVSWAVMARVLKVHHERIRYYLSRSK